MPRGVGASRLPQSKFALVLLAAVALAFGHSTAAAADVAAGSVTAAAGTAAGLPAETPADALDTAFHSPPESAKPWVFWYWMNAAVSKAGITADLNAMKAAGIGGAYLMPIKGPTEPPLLTPPVVQLTPEWWDCVRFAFVEADRLGLKLALHDCDGFATSGGPWITPEHSMQRVVWTETQLEGGRRVDVALAQPAATEGFYRDIAVLAFPARIDAGASSETVKPTVTTDRPGAAPQFLAQPGATDVFQSATPCWIQYAFAEPFTCRAITIKLPPAPNAYQPNTYQANRLIVEASNDGVKFRRVTRLEPPRHGWQDGDADVTHAIPATTARYFRFAYDPSGAEPGAEDLDSAKWKPTLKLRGITLASEARLHGFEGKSGAVWRVARPTTSAEVPDSFCVPRREVVDLTVDLDAQGRLHWTAPAGKWTVLRLGHTSTGHRNDTGGGGRGLEADKFDPAVVRDQYEHWFHEAVRQVGPELAGRVLKIFHVDSWECGSQNWSPVFRAEFRRRRGYDLLPYLPAMAGIPIESADVSERFLRDVRTTIAELLVDNFYGTMAKLAHQQGCGFSAESVAPTMVSDGMAHFADVDLPMGEFWLRSASHDKLNDVLDAVSGSRAYGRTIAQAEAFTELAIMWDESPWLLKPLQDRNYGFGVNRFVLHVFAHNPWPERRPGMTLNGVGLFFETNQTWMKPGRAWIEYTQRCQALLQLGHPAADIAVFTGEEIPRRALVPWELAPTLPGMIRSRAEMVAGRKAPQILEAGDGVDPLHGYAYDSINRDALLRLAKVRDGRLELPGGESYRILIVPGASPLVPIADQLTPEVAQRLREFVDAGLTVIVGEPPRHSPSLSNYPACDAIVAQVAAQLWPARRETPAPRTAGGRVATGPWTASNLEPLGLAPDLRATGADGAPAGGIAWTHRAAADWDLYFVSNQQSVERALHLSFRVAGAAPEIWDAVTGVQRPATILRQENGRTDIALNLAGSGSAFVVFRRHANATGSSRPAATDAVVSPVTGPWTVAFDHAEGGPAQPVSFAQPVSWTTQPATRNVSGTARYTHSLEWTPSQKPGARVWLDLGRVRDIAEVYVNGRSCGVAWTEPFRVDITSALKPGTNELRVDVTNTWFNRLAAEHALPEAQRTTWTLVPDRTEGKPLLEAGLLGPVNLRIE